MSLTCAGCALPIALGSPNLVFYPRPGGADLAAWHAVCAAAVGAVHAPTDPLPPALRRAAGALRDAADRAWSEVHGAGHGVDRNADGYLLGAAVAALLRAIADGVEAFASKEIE